MGEVSKKYKKKKQMAAYWLPFAFIIKTFQLHQLFRHP